MDKHRHKPDGGTSENAATPKTAEQAANTDDTLRVAEEETADGSTEHLTTEEVRQGHTGDHVRYILMASGAGIVAVFLIVYLFFMQ